MIRCEDIPHHADFRHLAQIEGVGHDLRYASSNNFSGRVLYSNIDCAFLRREAANARPSAASRRKKAQSMLLYSTRPLKLLLLA